MNAITRLSPQSVPVELERMTPQIRDMLPPGISIDRFKRVAMTAIVNNPKLLQCTPQSVMTACLKAAQDGLLPDGREGAIVPRGNLASWQPMTQGLIKKVKEKGGVANLSSNLVYAGEVFDVELGDEERIIHKRDLTKVMPGKEIAVYAIAKMKDGSSEREIMTREQVEAVRKFAKSGLDGPWGTNWDEMARKTVVRRLSKRLPALDDDSRRVIERVDDLYDFGKKADEPGIIFAGETVEADAPEGPQPRPARPPRAEAEIPSMDEQPAAPKPDPFEAMVEGFIYDVAILADRRAFDDIQARARRFFNTLETAGRLDLKDRAVQALEDAKPRFYPAVPPEPARALVDDEIPF